MRTEYNKKFDKSNYFNAQVMISSPIYNTWAAGANSQYARGCLCSYAFALPLPCGGSFK